MKARLLFLLLLGGCATDPRTGRTTWDAGTTFRIISAVSGALTPRTAEPSAAPPPALDPTDHP